MIQKSWTDRISQEERVSVFNEDFKPAMLTNAGDLGKLTNIIYADKLAV